VHYAQVTDLDPDGDGLADFYEFISGPLSAAFGRPVPPNLDLKPKTIYSEGGFANFGKITVDGNNLHLAIIDDTGKPRFERTIQAQR
jgi:alkaline phosphatase D